MPLSPIIESTLQSAVLNMVANVLAQSITAHRAGEHVSIDWIPVLQFLLFAVINTPPNFLWQQLLESSFPAHPSPPAAHPKKSDEKKPQQPGQPPLSIRNTLIKFFLDQTVGAAVNTLLFSFFIRSMHAAMPDAPRITNFRKAVDYWTASGTIDFTGVDFDRVAAEVRAEFLPIVLAGYKLWPAVSLVNFVFIKTVQGRNLVGALAGMGWGVYMSLVAAR